MTMHSTHTSPISATGFASEIKKLIGFGPLASLGAHGFSATRHNGAPALMFLARILPFNADGSRSVQPREMFVTVSYEAAPGDDLYTVEVQYTRRGDKFGTKGLLTHFSGTCFSSDLPTVLLALDYDGSETVNPRLLPDD